MYEKEAPVDSTPIFLGSEYRKPSINMVSISMHFG